MNVSVGRPIASTITQSSKSRGRTYHKVNDKSQVEEILFGIPNNVKMRNERMQKLAKSNDVVTILTKDLVRNLVVPRISNVDESVVVKRKEFERIKSSAHVLSRQEREALEQQRKAEVAALEKQVDRRRRILKELDEERVLVDSANGLANIEQREMNSLLERVNKQKLEQIDEIKKLNGMIENAKCQTIRDLQIMEKRQINVEMKEEIKRLDIMMEEERLNKIKIQEKIEEQRTIEKKLGAAAIIDQIKENQMQKLLELEEKDQENHMIKENSRKLVDQEIIQLQKIAIEKQEHIDQLNKANKELIEKRKLLKDLDRIEDQKMIQYQKKKAVEEAEKQAQAEKLRSEKEQEIARLRGMQERAIDEQANRDYLRAKRAQEENERRWRQKELNDALRNKQIQENLSHARASQKTQKERFLAIEAQKDRHQFETTLRKQAELLEKEHQKCEERRKNKNKYAKELRQQIHQKETEIMNTRCDYFKEGKKIIEDKKNHEERIHKIKMEKLEELKALGLPDKYVAQILRKSNKLNIYA